jgi:hypothetical protein
MKIDFYVLFMINYKNMSDISDDIFELQNRFKNSIDANFIQHTLLQKLKGLENKDIKYPLIQWRHFEDNNATIDNLRKINTKNQIYIDVVENLISTCLNDARGKLNAELRTIETTIQKKENDKNNKEKIHARDLALETKILNRLNRMPMDVVYIVRDFALTSDIRLKLLRFRLPIFTDRLNKMKLPKLKRLSRELTPMIQAIGHKITKNNNIMKSIPKYLENNTLSAILNVKGRIRETMKKGQKIEEIENNIQICETMIHSIERLGYPKTTNNLRTVLLKAIHLVTLASDPYFNRRTRRL